MYLLLKFNLGCNNNNRILLHAFIIVYSLLHMHLVRVGASEEPCLKKKTDLGPVPESLLKLS